MSRGISDLVREAILKLHREGLTRNEIAERKGLHPKTVQYAIAGRPKRKSFADQATECPPQAPGPAAQPVTRIRKSR